MVKYKKKVKPIVERHIKVSQFLTKKKVSQLFLLRF